VYKKKKYMDDACAVDVLWPERRHAVRLALPTRAMSSVVVIPRSLFDADLLSAFLPRNRETRATLVYRQVDLDAPRSHVYVDGVRVRSAAAADCCGLRNDRLLALLTQAVVGLPVELLHRAGHCVMEPPRTLKASSSPLTVRVLSDSGDFMAHKALAIAGADPERPRVFVVFLAAVGDHVHMHVSPG
jgi:hypothetical protein